MRCEMKRSCFQKLFLIAFCLLYNKSCGFHIGSNLMCARKETERIRGASGPLSKPPSLSERKSQKDAIICLSSAESDDLEPTNEPIIPEENKILHLVTNFDAKKTLTWAAFFLVMALLRPFYGVALGTFIFTYIGNSVVSVIMNTTNRLLGVVDETNTRLVARGRDPLLALRTLPRKTYALAYITILITTIVTATVFLVPKFNLESQYLTRIMQRESPYVVLTELIRTTIGEEPIVRLEAFLVSVYGTEGRAFAGITAEQARVLLANGPAGAPWTQERASQFSKLLQFSLRGQVRSIAVFARRLLKESTSILYNALISVLFSSMIVYDYPHLSESFRRLKKNKTLAYPYKLFSPKLRAFTRLVGQSFEVQTLIALCNTVLTTGGLFVLRIPGAVLMSLLVFVCSFIPLAGIIISTMPMAIVALTEFGVGKLGQVLAMVVIVHAVEAYLLNPQIYASKLKLHPLFVLVSLYITEHIAGVQGLFLAVPVAVYIFNEIILKSGDLEMQSSKS